MQLSYTAESRPGRDGGADGPRPRDGGAGARLVAVVDIWIPEVCARDGVTCTRLVVAVVVGGRLVGSSSARLVAALPTRRTHATTPTTLPTMTRTTTTPVLRPAGGGCEGGGVVENAKALDRESLEAELRGRLRQRPHGVYSFPALTPEFCDALLEEVGRVLPPKTLQGELSNDPRKRAPISRVSDTVW